MAATPGRRLDAIRVLVPDFTGWFQAQGPVSGVRTFDLVTIPYHRRYALWGVATVPSLLVHIATG
jgi:hypothetical protein